MSILSRLKVSYGFMRLNARQLALGTIGPHYDLWPGLDSDGHLAIPR